MDHFVYSSPVVWVALIVGLLIWAAAAQSSSPWKVLLLIAVCLVEPFCAGMMNWEARAVAWKYDRILQSVDQSLGLTAFQVARSCWGLRSALFLVYESLTLAMVLWYAGQVKTGASLLRSYFFAYVVGPWLYLIVPACGPRHAFAGFPFVEPGAGMNLVNLHYWPNAMPSLHVASALLLRFSARNRWMRIVSNLFLVGTVLATVTFEHYIIDLIVAVPFARFSWEAARYEWKRASIAVGVVLAWTLSIRWFSAFWVSHGLLLDAAALVTVIYFSGILEAFARVEPREAAPPALSQPISADQP